MTTALEQIEQDFPKIKGKLVEDNPEYTAYEDVGIRQKFLNLTEKYLRQLEREAGVKEPLQFDSEALIIEDHK